MRGGVITVDAVGRMESLHSVSGCVMLKTNGETAKRATKHIMKLKHYLYHLLEGFKYYRACLDLVS